MRILVVGGTGFIGTHLCGELYERGHEVTALTRSGDTENLPAGVAVETGDVTAYASIVDAFESQDAVVNLVALSPLFRPASGNGAHFAVHTNGTKHIVSAAEEHGVERMVQLSALGADPNGETAYIRSKGQAEGVVRDSELEWVILRPSVVFGDGGEFIPFTKQLALPYITPLPGGGRTQFQPIWIGDLVPIIADAIEDEEGVHSGEIHELGGPEVLTLAELAKLVHRAEGRSAYVLPVPMALAGIGLKFLEHVPTGVLDAVPGLPRMGADQYRSLQFDNTVPENDVVSFEIAEKEFMTVSEYLDVGS